MKPNLIALIALLVCCALASGAFRESMPDQGSPLRAVETVPTQQPREQHQTPLETPAPANAQELAYVVKIKNNQVEFQLTNVGSSVHHFYGNPLTLGYGDEVPSCAEIQVRQAASRRRYRCGTAPCSKNGVHIFPHRIGGVRSS